jgi:hypothetical protein
MLKRSTPNDFSTPKLLRDPTEVVIPRLSDDPEFSTAAALLSDFEGRLGWLNTERARIDLAEFLRLKEPNPKSETDTMLRARLATMNANAAAAPASAVAPGSPSPAIAAGIAVLNGATLPPESDHSTQRAALDRQITALNSAAIEQQEEVKRIAGELSFRYTKQLQPAWNQLQIEMYRAAQELARSAKRIRDFSSAINAAGIQSNDVLVTPNVRSPLVLGDESIYDSEIRGWGRILERLEILS